MFIDFPLFLEEVGVMFLDSRSSAGGTAGGGEGAAGGGTPGFESAAVRNNP